MREFILFDIVQEEFERENTRLPRKDKPISSQRGLLTTTWDIWRTRRGGERAITARREHRLENMIAFARAQSPFYEDFYSSLPAGIRDLQDLPPVSRSDLMESFDDWVTDPKVTKAGAEAFVADLDLVGDYRRTRYLRPRWRCLECLRGSGIIARHKCVDDPGESLGFPAPGRPSGDRDRRRRSLGQRRGKRARSRASLLPI